MTEQQFKKRLYTRLIFGVALFATGVFLYLYFPALGRIGDSHQDSYVYGLIIGLIVGGLGNTIKNLVILKKPDFFKKRFIAENDERNRQISQKAWAWAGYISVFAILLSTLFVPSEFVKYVIVLMCIPFVVYLITFWILRRQM
jgi:hypothetical protein